LRFFLSSTCAAYTGELAAKCGTLRNQLAELRQRGAGAAAAAVAAAAAQQGGCTTAGKKQKQSAAAAADHDDDDVMIVDGGGGGGGGNHRGDRPRGGALHVELNLTHNP
jgi:septal ring factor EnvC (AmiA/AmiB activator)